MLLPNMEASDKIKLPESVAAPVLSIIVISYNTREMTLACLASVVSETRLPYELIVVDNASEDGSAEAIAVTFPQVILLAEKTNHGFGPAHRIAMRHARTNWILLLNPDTVILSGAIDTLMQFAESRPKAGIWGGRTLYGDGSLNPTSCFAQMTLWSIFCRLFGLNGLFRSSTLFNSEYYGGWKRDTERAVDIVTGCFLLLRRDTWDRLGGFDDVFVMYGEEVDLCLRGRAVGLRPRVTPEATIIHYGGASQAIKSEKIIRLLRAKVELIRRHFPTVKRRLALELFRLWPASRMLAFGFIVQLAPTSSLASKAQVWKEVWAKRHEWQSGFGGSSKSQNDLSKNEI